MLSVWLESRHLRMNAGVKNDVASIESRLNRDVISPPAAPPAPAPAAAPAISLDGRASCGFRMAVRRLSRNRARITSITAPATLPTTPPTILLVVGGIVGPPVGGGAASVLVDVGPMLPPVFVPPLPYPLIHLKSESVVVVEEVEEEEELSVNEDVVEDEVESEVELEEVIEKGNDVVGLELGRDIRLELEFNVDEADDDPEELLAEDGGDDVCAGEDRPELISGRDAVAEAVEPDEVVVEVDEVADVKLLTVRLGVSAVSEL